jgi:hypothetical protein
VRVTFVDLLVRRARIFEEDAAGQSPRSQHQGRRTVREAARAGASKEMAAKTANTNRSAAGKRGGETSEYDELIAALRNH